MRKLFALSVVATLLLAYGCGASEERRREPDDAAGAGESAQTHGGNAEGPGGASGLDGGMGGAGFPTSAAGAGDAGGERSVPMGGAPSAGGPPIDGEAGAGGEPGGVVLPDALIVNQPYNCDAGGPFDGVVFDSYFYLEDWEDDLLDTPGVSADSSTLSSSFGPTLIDSVDCDDGIVDDQCQTCNALWGSGSVEVSFDAVALGALPTHVGLVWTDGGFGASVTIDAYDDADTIIDTQTVEGIGDGSNMGTTAEDRFFGIVHRAGIKRVHLANTGGGIEIDHLQYGR